MLILVMPDMQLRHRHFSKEMENNWKQGHSLKTIYFLNIALYLSGILLIKTLIKFTFEPGLIAVIKDVQINENSLL